MYEYLKKNEKVVYLKNKELLAEIIVSKQQGKLTKKAEEMMILLANKTIKKMRYQNPLDKEDCLQTGILVLFSNWHNFDPAKSTNAFSYLTEIFKRGIARGWQDLTKLKGDNDNTIKVVSLHSSNDGDGIYNL